MEGKSGPEACYSTHHELCHVVYTIQESSVTMREAHSGVTGGFYALCPW